MEKAETCIFSSGHGTARIQVLQINTQSSLAESGCLKGTKCRSVQLLCFGTSDALSCSPVKVEIGRDCVVFVKK
jgi:hypothetical protein